MPQEIERLISGYKQFRKHYFEGRDSTFEGLAQNGQSPKVLVVACSDSRVDPALVMNCKPGDLFVIRNVANLIPPYEDDDGYHGTSAALEFAICELGIKHVIVLGHSKCGGIQHLMHSDDNVKSKSFIGKWMQLAKPAKHKVEKEFADLSFDKKVEICSYNSVINSLENLKTFPWVAEKTKSGELFIHGWIFDLEKGVIKSLNPQTSKFEDVQ